MHLKENFFIIYKKTDIKPSAKILEQANKSRNEEMMQMTGIQNCNQ